MSKQTDTQGQRLLAAFTKTLGEMDPHDMASSRPHEYEPEAVSLLARFNEFHVGSLEGEDAQQVVHEIVTQTMRFWAGKDGPWQEKVESVAVMLHSVYMTEPA